MGVSSASDISISTVPVSSIMVRDGKTIREKQTILDDCIIMHHKNIGSVVVVREDKDPSFEPTGIITECDLRTKEMRSAGFEPAIPSLGSSYLNQAGLTSHD